MSSEENDENQSPTNGSGATGGADGGGEINRVNQNQIVTDPGATGGVTGGNAPNYPQLQADVRSLTEQIAFLAQNTPQVQVNNGEQ